VKRTADIAEAMRFFSVVRFTDFALYSCHPSSELLGYSQSSAKRGLRHHSCAKFQGTLITNT
jgi:hypothetical protein